MNDAGRVTEYPGGAATLHDSRYRVQPKELPPNPRSPFRISLKTNCTAMNAVPDRGLRSTEFRTLQPTGNKNTQKRTADAKPPFIYIEKF